VIDWLWRRGLVDLNLIATMDFPAEDRMQLAQLFGHSVSGFGDFPHASPREVATAHRRAAKLSASGPGKAAD